MSYYVYLHKVKPDNEMSEEELADRGVPPKGFFERVQNVFATKMNAHYGLTQTRGWQMDLSTTDVPFMVLMDILVWLEKLRDYDSSRTHPIVEFIRDVIAHGVIVSISKKPLAGSCLL